MTPDQITPAHLARVAYVYIRQSTYYQIEVHTESQRRQRALAEFVVGLGWPCERVVLVDGDLGHSADGRTHRKDFDSMVADVALGHCGIIAAADASRLSRSNQDWYHLLDICSVTGTLIADGEGAVYDPKLYNDRLLLGLKGTLAEAELHVMKQRMIEAIRSKAKRGEFRCQLPVGYVWDEDDRIVKTPDEQVTSVIALLFGRFDRFGTIHQTHVSLAEDGIQVPVSSGRRGRLSWRIPTYAMVHRFLTHPIYAGIYVFGRRQTRETLNAAQRVTKRQLRVDAAKCHAWIPGHHEGYLSMEAFERNQERIRTNRRSDGPGSGAPREGAALLQGLVMCGRCGRSARVQYGRDGLPSRYVCAEARRLQGTGICQGFGPTLLERAVEQRVLEALLPLGIDAMIDAAARYQEADATERDHWQQRTERARYEVDLARRRYEAVDPANRLLARDLERRLEAALTGLQQTEQEAERRLRALVKVLTDDQKASLRRYATDLPRLWGAPTTRPQDRKRIVRCLIERVVVTISEDGKTLHSDLHWTGGEVTRLDIPRRQRNDPRPETDEDVVTAVRELAVEFSDAQIARILSRKGIATAKGHPFTRHRVGELRFRFGIPNGPSVAAAGPDIYSAQDAAELLGVTASTVLRWAEAGLLRAHQMTPQAPWRVRVTEEDRQRLTVADAPKGWLSLKGAAQALGLSQQAVLQQLNRGKLEGVRVHVGRRTSWRINIISNSSEASLPLFNPPVFED